MCCISNLDTSLTDKDTYQINAKPANRVPCSLPTPGCFPVCLVNATSMESCSVCSETGFVSVQICMKTFVVFVDAAGWRGRIYCKGTPSKIALWRYVSRSCIWTSIREIIVTHETKTSFHFKAEYLCREKTCFMTCAIIVDMCNYGSVTPGFP